jgi:hypothetical protein
VGFHLLAGVVVGVATVLALSWKRLEGFHRVTAVCVLIAAFAGAAGVNPDQVIPGSGPTREPQEAAQAAWWALQADGFWLTLAGFALGFLLTAFAVDRLSPRPE